MIRRDKVSFICYLIASICFYISAIIGIVNKNESNWVVDLCLGSAFLGLSSTHKNKDKKRNKNDI